MRRYFRGMGPLYWEGGMYGCLGGFFLAAIWLLFYCMQRWASSSGFAGTAFVGLLYTFGLYVAASEQELREKMAEKLAELDRHYGAA